MKLTYLLILLMIVGASCKKSKEKVEIPLADVQETIAKNAAKVTITNGVWGTITKKEGNCMPSIDKSSNCKSYIIKREVRIYAYTTINNTVPQTSFTGLYDSFNTQLIKSVTTDEEGFYQAELPNGKYTIVFVEDGKLYATTGDGQGGISPVEVVNNRVVSNLVLDRAAY